MNNCDTPLTMFNIVTRVLELSLPSCRIPSILPGGQMGFDFRFRRTNTPAAAPGFWLWLLTFVVAGCGTNPPDSVGQAPQTEEQNERKFDAGRLLRGERASHAFSFSNETSDELTLDFETDIRKTCGCTQAEVAKSTLQPGEATEVTLNIETKAKSGSFSESSVLVWRNSNGAGHPVKYELSGHVISPLVFTPKAVLLETRDIVEGKVFDVSVTSELDLDWSSAKVMGLSESLSCKFEANATGGVLRFRVDKYKQTAPILADVVCSVAPSYATDESAPDAVAERRYSGTIPIYLEPAETLRLAANSLLLQTADGSEEYRASLMILGSAGLVPQDGAFVRFGGNAEAIKHQIVPISDALFRVDLSIPSAFLTGAAGDPEIVVRLDGNREQSVRIYLPRS